MDFVKVAPSDLFANPVRLRYIRGQSRKELWAFL
jgi:hypothetical protein